MQAGSVIASVAAGKAGFEIEAGAAGVVEEVLVSDGTVAEVGMVIARSREE